MINIDKLKNRIKILENDTSNSVKYRRSICISEIIGIVDLVDYKIYYELVLQILKIDKFYHTNLDDILLLKSVVSNSYFMPQKLKNYLVNFVPIEYSFNKLIL